MPPVPQVADKPAMLAKPLRWLVQQIIKHPSTTFLASVLIALGATFYAAAGLRFKTDRGDLLGPNSKFNQFWLDYDREFQPADDLVFAVTGPNTDLVTDALQDIADRIAAQSDHFSHLFYKTDFSVLKRKGCFFLAPEQLARMVRELDQLGPILEGNWELLNLPQPSSRATASDRRSSRHTAWRDSATSHT